MTIAALNGAKLWFDDWGGTGEPILLHHGYTATRENWGYDGDPRLVVATGTLLRQPAQRKHQTNAICERERSESALTYLLAPCLVCALVCCVRHWQASPGPRVQGHLHGMPWNGRF